MPGNPILFNNLYATRHTLSTPFGKTVFGFLPQTRRVFIVGIFPAKLERTFPGDGSFRPRGVTYSRLLFGCECFYGKKADAPMRILWSSEPQNTYPTRTRMHRFICKGTSIRPGYRTVPCSRHDFDYISCSLHIMQFLCSLRWSEPLICILRFLVCVVRILNAHSVTGICVQRGDLDYILEPGIMQQYLVCTAMILATRRSPLCIP